MIDGHTLNHTELVVVVVVVVVVNIQDAGAGGETAFPKGASGSGFKVRIVVDPLHN